jgi:hypothetical protein
VSVIAIDNIAAFALQVEVAHFSFPEGVKQLPLHRHLHDIGYVPSAFVIKRELVSGVLRRLA